MNMIYGLLYLVAPGADDDHTDGGSKDDSEVGDDDHGDVELRRRARSVRVVRVPAALSELREQTHLGRCTVDAVPTAVPRSDSECPFINVAVQASVRVHASAILVLWIMR